MTKTNKRKHGKTNRDYYENRRRSYDQQYGNVYYIDRPPLPPPYYSQLPPPYYYATQDGGRSALPVNAGIPQMRESFYAKRPLVQVKASEESKEHRKDAKEDKKKFRDGGKENGTERGIKKVKTHEKQKLSILKRISNGITHALETFFYK